MKDFVAALIICDQQQQHYVVYGLTVQEGEGTDGVQLYVCVCVCGIALMHVNI